MDRSRTETDAVIDSGTTKGDACSLYIKLRKPTTRSGQHPARRRLKNWGCCKIKMVEFPLPRSFNRTCGNGSNPESCLVPATRGTEAESHHREFPVAKWSQNRHRMKKEFRNNRSAMHSCEKLNGFFHGPRNGPVHDNLNCVLGHALGIYELHLDGVCQTLLHWNVGDYQKYSPVECECKLPRFPQQSEGRERNRRTQTSPRKKSSDRLRTQLQRPRAEATPRRGSCRRRPYVTYGTTRHEGPQIPAYPVATEKYKRPRRCVFACCACDTGARERWNCCQKMLTVLVQQEVRDYPSCK